MPMLKNPNPSLVIESTLEPWASGKGAEEAWLSGEAKLCSVYSFLKLFQLMQVLLHLEGLVRTL